jgi:hypothetical protein
VNLILHLKELWRRRALVAIAVLAAAAISILAVFQVSFFPPSISKRSQVTGQGTIEILVDSSRSPIADVGRKLTPLTDRAGVFARYIGGGDVLEQVSKGTGIPVKQIDVAGPTPLPGEAPGAAEASPELHPYGIAIAQRDALPIVNVATRAPTVGEARDLAAAVPAAVRQVVESIQERQRIPLDDRVKFKALGPAQAAPVVDAVGLKVALALFVFLLGLSIAMILGIPRLVAAWRSAESDSSLPEDRVEPPSAVLAVATEEDRDPDVGGVRFVSRNRD